MLLIKTMLRLRHHCLKAYEEGLDNSFMVESFER
jgi:hypothetical protein